MSVGGLRRWWGGATRSAAWSRPPEERSRSPGCRRRGFDPAGCPRRLHEGTESSLTSGSTPGRARLTLASSHRMRERRNDSSKKSAHIRTPWTGRTRVPHPSSQGHSRTRRARGSADRRLDLRDALEYVDDLDVPEHRLVVPLRAYALQCRQQWTDRRIVNGVAPREVTLAHRS